MATFVISETKMEEKAKRFKRRRYCISYITRYATREKAIGKSIKGISWIKCHIRVVRVKVGEKEYTRPISKLSPLEFDEH